MMELQYMILLSKQGKTRMIKWFDSFTPQEKHMIIKDVTTLVLSRKSRMCNIIEYSLHGTGTNTHRVIYKRYASLFFVAGIATVSSSKKQGIKKQQQAEEDGTENSENESSAGAVEEDCNELLVLEAIHRYVETLDKYFGNVRELDIIFNFEKAYHIMHEMFNCNGSLLETSRKDILSSVAQMDQMESSDDLNSVLS